MSNGDLGAATSAGSFVKVKECKAHSEGKDCKHPFCKTLAEGQTSRTYALSKMRMVDISWLINWLKKQMPDPREEARKSLDALDPGPPPKEPEPPPGSAKDWTPEQMAWWSNAVVDHQKALGKYQRMQAMYERQVDRLIDKMDADTKSDQFESADISRVFRRPEGLGIMLYLSARAMHPEVTPDWFQVVDDYDLDDTEALVAEVAEINKGPEDDDGDDAKNSSREPGRRRSIRKLPGSMSLPK